MNENMVHMTSVLEEHSDTVRQSYLIELWRHRTDSHSEKSSLASVHQPPFVPHTPDKWTNVLSFGS